MFILRWWAPVISYIEHSALIMVNMTHVARQWPAHFTTWIAIVLVSYYKFIRVFKIHTTQLRNGDVFGRGQRAHNVSVPSATSLCKLNIQILCHCLRVLHARCATLRFSVNRTSNSPLPGFWFVPNSNRIITFQFPLFPALECAWNSAHTRITPTLIRSASHIFR